MFTKSATLMRPVLSRSNFLQTVNALRMVFFVLVLLEHVDQDVDGVFGLLDFGERRLDLFLLFEELRGQRLGVLLFEVRGVLEECVHFHEGLHFVEEADLAGFELDEFEQDEVYDFLADVEVVEQDAHFAVADEFAVAHALPLPAELFAEAENFFELFDEDLVVCQTGELVLELDFLEVGAEVEQRDAGVSVFVDGAEEVGDEAEFAVAESDDV